MLVACLASRSFLRENSGFPSPHEPRYLQSVRAKWLITARRKGGNTTATLFFSFVIILALNNV